MAMVNARRRRWLRARSRAPLKLFKMRCTRAGLTSAPDNGCVARNNNAAAARVPRGACLEVLGWLRQLDVSEPFARPVEGVPRYTELVSDPVDLGLIQRRLEGDGYRETGAAGFAAKMAAKLKERRAAVAKREAVDKRKAVLSRVLSRRTPSPRRRPVTLHTHRRSASATTPTTSTASSRRRTMWTKVSSSRRWRPRGRKRGRRDVR